MLADSFLFVIDVDVLGVDFNAFVLSFVAVALNGALPWAVASGVFGPLAAPGRPAWLAL